MLVSITKSYLGIVGCPYIMHYSSQMWQKEPFSASLSTPTDRKSYPQTPVRAVSTVFMVFDF